MDRGGQWNFDFVLMPETYSRRLEMSPRRGPSIRRPGMQDKVMLLLLAIISPSLSTPGFNSGDLARLLSRVLKMDGHGR